MTREHAISIIEQITRTRAAQERAQQRAREAGRLAPLSRGWDDNVRHEATASRLGDVIQDLWETVETHYSDGELLDLLSEARGNVRRRAV